MTSLEDAFPEIAEMTDDDQRDRVVEVWATAIADSDYDDLADVPWWPPHEAVVGSSDLVGHVRDVVRCAIAICDSLTLSQSELEIRRDDLIAGALLHDVSKPFEIADGELVETHDLLPHPHYAVHLLASCDVSKHVQHIVIAHSGRSGVAPRTMEAKIVAVADELAVDGRYWSTTSRLKPDG
ncbi:HD domain-containing protein [Halobium palmae]|uniref:HD domain-containing protein n=1 Tax=Halobium palmae TaxID=1776492 RepID=A0ABD5RYZ6_9EURY